MELNCFKCCVKLFEIWDGMGFSVYGFTYFKPGPWVDWQ